jgi:hypothetical protein
MNAPQRWRRRAHHKDQRHERDRACWFAQTPPDRAGRHGEGLDWIGLEAVRFRASPGAEHYHPALTHHMLVVFTAPPKEVDLRYEGVERHVPPPAGSISLIPAGSPIRVRVNKAKNQLHIFLAPDVLARVAADEFDLDPARLSLPPLDALHMPHLRATMTAVEAELTAGAAHNSIDRPASPLSRAAVRGSVVGQPGA